MIMNDHQREVTQTWLDKFKSSLKQLNEQDAESIDIHPELVQAHKRSLESKIKEFTKELEDYDKMSKGS